MKSIKLFVFVLLALIGLPARAQEQCIEGAVNCAEATDDPICVVQTRFGVAQTGRCDRATALALIGDNFSRYYQFRGTFLNDAEQMAFAICSRTGPVRKDGKCGWYRFEAAEGGGGGPGDPIATIRSQLGRNRQGVTAAEAAVQQAEKVQADYRRALETGLDIRLGRFDWGVFGPAVGATNAGNWAGVTAALHVPAGRHRSGVEIGLHAGFAGHESDPLKVHLVGQLGPFAQGVIMPWPRFGFVLGGEWQHRFPGEASNPEDFVGTRLGLRFYPAERFALEVVTLTGGVRDDAENWSGAGGVAAAALVHF